MTIRKLAAGFLALSVLAGCSSASSTSDASDASDATNNATDEAEAYGLKTIGQGSTLYDIGETIEQDGVKYTLESVYPTDHNFYYHPEEGHELYFCVLNIENTTDKTVSINAIDWTMRESGGTAPYPLDLRLQDDHLLTDFDLAPGESIEGEIVFDGDTSKELILYPPAEDAGTMDNAWVIQTYDGFLGGD